MRSIKSLIPLISMIFSAAAFAQNAVTPKQIPALRQVLGEGEIIPAILDDVKKHYVDELGICEELKAEQIKFESRDELETIEDSLKKIGALTPAMGLYLEHYSISGCEDATRLNMTIYTAPGVSVPFIGFDGNTRTYAGIQNDFMKQVAQASGVAKPDCSSINDLAVLTTRYTGELPLDEFSGEPGYTYQQAWTETWTTRVCAERIELPVRLGRSLDGSLGISIRMTKK